jgi:hypothetical protein
MPLSRDRCKVQHRRDQQPSYLVTPNISSTVGNAEGKVDPYNSPSYSGVGLDVSTTSIIIHGFNSTMQLGDNIEARAELFAGLWFYDKQVSSVDSGALVVIHGSKHDPFLPRFLLSTFIACRHLYWILPTGASIHSLLVSQARR